MSEIESLRFRIIENKQKIELFKLINDEISINHIYNPDNGFYISHLLRNQKLHFLSKLKFFFSREYFAHIT